MRALTLIIAIFCSTAMAKLPNISKPCDLMGHLCSPAQLDISNKFSQASGLHEEKIPLLVSGECYHNGNYDPNYTHHGVLLFEEINGNIHATGRYSFYFGRDPYAQWDLDEARMELNDISNPKHLVMSLPDQAYLEYPIDEGRSLKYWFRQDPKTGVLYVFGHWTGNHYLLCEMGIH